MEIKKNNKKKAFNLSAFFLWLKLNLTLIKFKFQQKLEFGILLKYWNLYDYDLIFETL